MGGVLTAFIIFVLFPGVILGFILLSRYLKYRETVTMLQHGIPPPLPSMMSGAPVPPMVVVNRNERGTGRGTLIWGLVLAAIGLALTLALWPIGFIANSASDHSVNFPLGLGPWMLVGFIPLFVGLALILGYVITRPEDGPNLPPALRAPGFPTGEGGDVGAYSRTPSPPVSYMPTEATTKQEATEPAPPNA